MRFQDVKIGDRVVHRVYGEGIVQGIRPFQGTFVAEVVFDNAMNGSDVKQRTIMIDFLDKSKFPSKPLYRSQPTIAYNGNTTIKNNFQYHVGDRVVHSYFGEGEVTTIRSSMYIGVRFKKNNQERFVQSKELSSMPIEVIHETEEYIEDESSALKVIPSNYANQSCYYLYFSEIGKKIYSACSRAREGLFIFDDTDDKSPIKQIIRPSNGGSYYDEH